MILKIHLDMWYLTLKKDSDHIGNYNTEYYRGLSFLCFTLYLIQERQ